MTRPGVNGRCPDGHLRPAATRHRAASPDRLQILREPCSLFPGATGGVRGVGVGPPVPGTVEVGVDVTQIDAEVVLVDRVPPLEAVNQLPEVLVRVVELVHQHRPRNRMFVGVEHARPGEEVSEEVLVAGQSHNGLEPGQDCEPVSTVGPLQRLVGPPWSQAGIQRSASGRRGRTKVPEVGHRSARSS